MAVNKKDFINCMAENGNKTKKSCREYLDLMLDTFYELLEEGETIRFCRIMNVETKITPERPARNPQNGKVCIVPERKRIKVTFSEVLRDKLNGERD